MSELTPHYFQMCIRTMTQSDELGDSFTLPYSKELEDAVLLIYNECNKEVDRRNKTLVDEFLAKKYQELLKTPTNAKEILHSIITECPVKR